MTGRKKGGSDSVLRQAKDELYQSYLKRDLWSQYRLAVVMS